MLAATRRVVALLAVMATATLGPVPPAHGADPPPDTCGDPGNPVALVSDVQGSGAVYDPGCAGTQTVEGVVTAVKPGLSGLYLQEEAADADDDPASSEDIFVFAGSGVVVPVQVGERARVTGTVGEFTSSTGAGSSQTQLSRPTVVGLGPAGEPVGATAVALGGDLERFEGMLAELTDTLVISEYVDYDRYGEVVLAQPLAGRDRLDTPTAVVDPGEPARALATENASRTITLDDSSARQNPPQLPHPGNGQPFSLDNRFRGGDTVTGVEGVIDHTFGRYRVQPTSYGRYAAANPRPAPQAPDVGGRVTVASFNVLNYFLTIDDGVHDVCGADAAQECRGADSEAERQRQRAKILAALEGLDADVVGLMELENTPGVDPVADLVAGLNERYGAPVYAGVDTGVIGSDAIRLGLAYKPATVRPAGPFAILDAADDPRYADTLNRPMLTQTFDEVATGARVTVSVSHLKSKGSACADGSDPTDGQGSCSVTRTMAAAAIADYLAADPTRSGDPDHLVIGDLNSYDHETPITTLRAAGYVDLVRRYGGEHAYGYVFDGQVGYLDHGLAGATLAPQVAGAAEWHVNADEPDLLDYDTSFKPPAQAELFEPDAFRSSDHDPVLVGLDLSAATRPACYCHGAQHVVSYAPGRRANGTPVPARQADPAAALGTAGGRRARAVSLGLGGDVVLGFDRAVQNTNGAAYDLRVVDLADGANGRRDAARVSVSFDGTTWVDAGAVSGTGKVDLVLPAARFVRVSDTTSSRQRQHPVTDGYDLDAVEVLTGCA